MGELERCRDAGMDDMLTKPIDFARLRATLEARSIARTSPHGGASLSRASAGSR